MIPTSKFIDDLKRSGGMTRSKLRKLKVRKWKYPLALERQYTSAISRFLQKRWKEYAAIAIPMMVPREDALEDLEPVPGTNGPALGAIVNIAKSLDAFNKKELDAFKKIAIGEAFQEQEPWVKNVLDSWAREQVTLITKASQDMLDTVARRIRDGVKVGKSAREVTAMINADLPGISYRRARIIARDQTAKLNSSLTQGRMADAGLETYIWDTAQDERVRGNPTGLYANAIPSHFIMQGKLCRWDDPSVWFENGEWVKRPGDAPYFHPGMAIMCRCVALPNWDELEDVGASDLPEPEPVAAPPAVEEPPEPSVDVGIFKSEQLFSDSLKAQFPITAKFKKDWMEDAFSRFSNLEPNVRKYYSGTFTGFLQNIEKGTKAYYSPYGKYIQVPGYFRKDHQRSASVLLHEMGHAMDARLGQRRGAKLISYVRLDKYGGRNLAEIVRDDLINPIYEAAKAERPEMFRVLLKGITKEAREEISRILSENSSSIRDWGITWKLRNALANGHPDDRIRALNIALLNSAAPIEIFEAIAKGNDKAVLEFLLEKTESSLSKGTLLEIDKYSKAFRELLEVAKEADDEEAIFGGISDMFEAATGHPGSFGRWGHGERYWREDYSNASTEAFAEILEILGSPSPKKNYILDKYLPTARDFVLDAIKEAEL
jgi:hypothetical protein